MSPESSLSSAEWVAERQLGKVGIWNKTLARTPTYLGQLSGTVSGWVLREPDMDTTLNVQDICQGKQL